MEKGIAPERVVASREGAEDETEWTRPPCPSPEVARWDRAGDPNREENWSRVAPLVPRRAPARSVGFGETQILAFFDDPSGCPAHPPASAGPRARASDPSGPEAAAGRAAGGRSALTVQAVASPASRLLNVSALVWRLDAPTLSKPLRLIRAVRSAHPGVRPDQTGVPRVCSTVSPSSPQMRLPEHV